MIKELIVLILIVAITFFAGLSAGKRSGYSEATLSYNKTIAEYNTALSNQTTLLNTVLKTEAIDLTKEVSSLLKDTQDIKKQLKNQPQPLVLVNQGECIASQSTLEARRKMIERVNK